MTGNVKRWRNGGIILRWIAAGVVEAERQFRRLNGYRDLQLLRAALERTLPTGDALTATVARRAQVPRRLALLQWALRRSYCVTRPISAPHPTESCQSRPPAVGRVASAALFATGWLPMSAAGPARRLPPLALLRAGAQCTG